MSQSSKAGTAPVSPDVEGDFYDLGGGANALVRVDQPTRSLTSYAFPDNAGNVRQILGRPGEIWGAESAADALVRIRTSAG